MDAATATTALGLAGGVAAASLAAGSYAYFAPRSQWLGPVVFRGPAQPPARVALTFDDGPSPRWTPAILDELAALGVSATFFAIGQHAGRYPDLVRRIDAEGHLLGNHSLHHHYGGLFGRRRYWRGELAQTDHLLADLTGKMPAFFRPPMGFKNGPMLAAARQRGLMTVTWTRRSFDALARSPRSVVARLGPRAQPGDILLLHDGVDPHGRGDRSVTLASVRPLVEALRQRGLQAVRLDHLLGVPGYRESPEPA